MNSTLQPKVIVEDCDVAALNFSFNSSFQEDSPRGNIIVTTNETHRLLVSEERRSELFPNTTVAYRLNKSAFSKNNSSGSPGFCNNFAPKVIMISCKEKSNANCDDNKACLSSVAEEVVQSVSETSRDATTSDSCSPCTCQQSSIEGTSSCSCQTWDQSYGTPQSSSCPSSTQNYHHPAQGNCGTHSTVSQSSTSQYPCGSKIEPNGKNQYHHTCPNGSVDSTYKSTSRSSSNGGSQTSSRRRVCSSSNRGSTPKESFTSRPQCSTSDPSNPTWTGESTGTIGSRRVDPNSGLSKSTKGRSSTRDCAGSGCASYSPRTSSSTKSTSSSPRFRFDDTSSAVPSSTTAESKKCSRRACSSRSSSSAGSVSRKGRL